MSSTTTTKTLQSSEPVKMTSIPAVTRDPKDSMKSTWRTWDRSRWEIHHWLFDVLKLHPTDLDREVPVHAKTDKMPYMPPSEGHKWILVHAAWPLLVHQAYISLVGANPHWLVVILFYAFSFHFNAIHEVRKMRDLGHLFGYLDGDKHERDQVPDVRAASVLHSLELTATIRPMMSVLFAYRSSVSPLSSLSWWVPVEIGVYGIVLDFWFYWYHRIMHESETLWTVHRTHHLTKHPTPLLSLYADQVQEIFDIVGIPLLTLGSMKLMGFPMGFTDFWICQQYVVFTELWGHSGLRIYFTPPTTATPLLKLFDSELITEDHDLHHRKGWKQAGNYGKQTRVWDRLFGTCFERIEMTERNIDWNDRAAIPLW